MVYICLNTNCNVLISVDLLLTVKLHLSTRLMTVCGYMRVDTELCGGHAKNARLLCDIAIG